MMNRIPFAITICFLAMTFVNSASGMYDPHLGRFCSKDPIGFHSGTANIYELCRTQPLKLIDPNGLMQISPPVGIDPHDPAPVIYDPRDPPTRDWQLRIWLFNRLSGDCDSCSHCNPNGVVPNGCDQSQCMVEAMNIADAVGNTLENNVHWNPIRRCWFGYNNVWWYEGGFPFHYNERYNGYFCSRWAQALYGAVLAANSSCFSAEIEYGANLDTGRMHLWVTISNNCSGVESYVDDSFWDRAFGHITRPCGGEGEDYPYRGPWDPDRMPDMGPCPQIYDPNMQPQVWPWVDEEILP
ncbi:MAG: RHS repeat-associated core domain-containing protein [Pirellulaceae bacterium]